MTGMATAFAIGVAFGFVLERAGLGNARKLIGQFHLTDLTVFKVMFSAIVTAMLGCFWLSRLGLIDLAGIYVPETFLPAQLAGGAIFGVGFAVAGLCPGTSCVSAASGRADGLAVVAGMFSGVLGAGIAFDALQPLYSRSPHGTWLLPDLFHVSSGAVVLAVVLLALAGFSAAERLERRAATPSGAGSQV